MYTHNVCMHIMLHLYVYIYIYIHISIGWANNRFNDLPFGTPLETNTQLHVFLSHKRILYELLKGRMLS